MSFKLSEAAAPGGGGMPPAGTLTHAFVRIPKDALEKASQHKLKIVLELTPRKWLVDKTWNFETTPTRDGKMWMLNDVASMLEAAGETVEGNPAYDFETLNQVLAAINGKRVAVETGVYTGSDGKDRASIERFLSPNAKRGTSEKFGRLSGAQGGLAAAAAPVAPTTPAASAAPRRPAI